MQTPGFGVEASEEEAETGAIPTANLPLFFLRPPLSLHLTKMNSVILPSTSLFISMCPSLTKCLQAPPCQPIGVCALGFNMHPTSRSTRRKIWGSQLCSEMETQCVSGGDQESVFLTSAPGEAGVSGECKQWATSWETLCWNPGSDFLLFISGHSHPQHP